MCTTSTFSHLRPVDTGYSQKKKYVSSFSHSSKADVTFFTGTKREILTRSLCVRRWAHETRHCSGPPGAAARPGWASVLPEPGPPHSSGSAEDHSARLTRPSPTLRLLGCLCVHAEAHGSEEVPRRCPRRRRPPCAMSTWMRSSTRVVGALNPLAPTHKQVVTGP